MTQRQRRVLVEGKALHSDPDLHGELVVYFEKAYDGITQVRVLASAVRSLAPEEQKGDEVSSLSFTDATEFSVDGILTVAHKNPDILHAQRVTLEIRMGLDTLTGPSREVWYVNTWEGSNAQHRLLTKRGGWRVAGDPTKDTGDEQAMFPTADAAYATARAAGFKRATEPREQRSNDPAPVPLVPDPELGDRVKRGLP